MSRAESEFNESRPPIGLKPRSIHDGDRVQEIISAIKRYSAAGKNIPIEWIDELETLTGRG